jgi:hypothetical protein
MEEQERKESLADILEISHHVWLLLLLFLL